jgi:hypothetical protein
MRTLLRLLCLSLVSALLASIGCSSTLLECRAQAAADLPLEPEQITAGDVETVIRKVKACQGHARPPRDDPLAGDAGP